MQRVTYEEMLIQYIQESELDLALSMISRLQKTNSLNYLDENGKSFLNHALEACQKDLAKILLELLKDAPEIIFGEDKDKQTCLFLAAKQGYADIVEMIIDIAKDAKPSSKGYKNWLKPNNKANTPLHVAAKYKNLEVVKLLLEQLAKENKHRAKDLVNRVNIDRNTALHLACFSTKFPYNDELICLLIQHGSDLNLTNADRQSPLHLICELNLEEQSNLLDLLLQNEVQEIFLHSYNNYVKENSDNDIVKNNYDKLCEKRDITIYRDALKESGFNLEDDMVKQPIPDYLLAKKNNLNSDVKQPSPPKPVAKYQLFQEDDDTLQKLISDVEDYVTDLQNRPSGLISYKTLGRLAAATFTLSYISIETWQIIMALKYGNLSRDYDSPRSYEYSRLYVNYTLGSVIFGTLGGFSTLFLNVITMFPNHVSAPKCITTGEVPVKISHDEWKGTIATMRNSIRIALLEKLLLLEEKEHRQTSSDDAIENKFLPTNPQDIRDLEANLIEFDNENKTITEMIDILLRLDEILKRIQNNMRQTNKPFSMFFKPVDTIIDINESIEDLSDDELRPILDGNIQFI